MMASTVKNGNDRLRKGNKRRRRRCLRSLMTEGGRRNATIAKIKSSEALLICRLNNGHFYFKIRQSACF